MRIVEKQCYALSTSTTPRHNVQEHLMENSAKAAADALQACTGSTQVTYTREVRKADGTLEVVESHTAKAAPTYLVSYYGAGRWQVTKAGEVVGMLHQNSIQAWYATSATGVRLAVHGHHEYGGNARPLEIANTMVNWS